MEIRNECYSEIDYRIFNQSPILRISIIIAKIILFPFILPFIFIAKLSSKTCFRAISEFFSLIPFPLGEIVRFLFYKFVLKRCGKNVFINIGTVFYYPEISIGDNVLIGMYNTIHHCDFGDNVLTAEGCRFLSGSMYHHFSRTDIPMSLQGGKLKRISIGSDVWIGSNSVLMNNVKDGSIVGAGSVVIKEVEPYCVVAGNPAEVIKKRK